MVVRSGSMKPNRGKIVLLVVKVDLAGAAVIGETVKEATPSDVPAATAVTGVELAGGVQDAPALSF